MFDLFGYKSKQQGEIVYSEYINSSEWKKKRQAKLEAAGNKCERCGLSKFSVKLDVHHLTYERLGHERMEDLQVLCKACHEGADFERMESEQDKKKRGALVNGFKKWIQRKGFKIEEMAVIQAVKEKKEFLTYLRDESGVCYSLDLHIIGISDYEPDWKPSKRGPTQIIGYD